MLESVGAAGVVAAAGCLLWWYREVPGGRDEGGGVVGWCPTGWWNPCCLRAQYWSVGSPTGPTRCLIMCRNYSQLSYSLSGSGY